MKQHLLAMMVVQFRVLAVALVFFTASRTGSVMALPTTCRCPPVKLHSTVSVRPDPSEMSYEVGATFEIYCSESKRPVPPIQSSTIVRCEEDCIWSEDTSGVECLERQCPRIEEKDLPQNVTLRYETTASGLLDCGAIARFRCPNGFERHRGPRYWYCECNGNWSSKTLPQCKAKTCDTLSSPDNAYCQSTGEVNDLKTVRECFCDPEFYSVDGSGVFVCDITDRDGNVDWVGQLYCSRRPVTAESGRCREPHNNDNSIMMAPISGNAYPVGTAIKYLCLPGTTIVGSNVILCNESLQWFPDPPKCAVAKCKHPALRDHAVHVMGDQKSRYPYGSRQRYACPPGYHLLGPSVRQCIGVDQWSGNEPKCKRLCPDPGIPVDGTRTLQGIFYEGSKVVYQCDKDRVLNGSSQITCQANGEWTDRIPSCRYDECQKPLVRDSLVTQKPPLYSSYWHNEVIHYGCPKGYKINGSKRRKCLRGEWSGDDPRCKKSG